MKPPALPLVLGGEWYRANMVQTELLAGIVEGASFVERAIIGYDADVGNTKAVAISDCGLEKSDEIYCLLVGEDIVKLIGSHPLPTLTYSQPTP